MVAFVSVKNNRIRPYLITKNTSCPYEQYPFWRSWRIFCFLLWKRLCFLIRVWTIKTEKYKDDVRLAIHLWKHGYEMQNWHLSFFKKQICPWIMRPFNKNYSGFWSTSFHNCFATALQTECLNSPLWDKTWTNPWISSLVLTYDLEFPETEFTCHTKL